MDIAVLGRGVIGLTMASLLVKNGRHNVTLIGPDTAADSRYSAITRASKNILSHLGAWENIIANLPGMYDKMYLWDQSTNTEVVLRAVELGAAELGHIVSNNVIIESLKPTLADVKIVSGMAKSICYIDDGVSIRLDDCKINAQLVIGADGGQSWLRRQLGISNYGWDYNHEAIVTTVETFHAHNNTATQRFAADGPLAFLPLADDNLCSIVWSTSPVQAAKLMKMNDTDFANEIGVAKVCIPRVKFPLRMMHAKQYTTNNAALIGDAAHVIHPLAGQGMNLGFLDAATLSECLYGVEPNNLQSALRKYERIRKSHNWGMIATMEMIKRLFGTSNPVIQRLRKIGMQGINSFPFTRELLAKAGMGVYGELPASAINYL